MNVPDAVVILGPTATGKSALALALARCLPVEIISMDSAMVYRGMDIGTAKPDLAARTAVPHHLLDICNPDERYSAASFRRDCLSLVRTIRARGRLPVICGGTMLYYRALIRGLDPMPAVSVQVREQVSAELAACGAEALHARLRTIDPQSYARLSPHDTQRVARAWEVYYASGRPLSSFARLKPAACPIALREFRLLPQADRSVLRRVIRVRFLEMLEAGLLDEVRSLTQRFALTNAHPALRCVGYRQVHAYLCGGCSYAEMIERAVVATAHLAKHQMTWLRGVLRYTVEQVRVLRAGDADNLQLVLEDLALTQRNA